jgi:hypothetical protein
MVDRAVLAGLPFPIGRYPRITSHYCFFLLVVRTRIRAIMLPKVAKVLFDAGILGVARAYSHARSNPAPACLSLPAMWVT